MLPRAGTHTGTRRGATGANVADDVDDTAVSEVGHDVAGDSVRSGVVVDSVEETGGPRVVDDVIGKVAGVCVPT